MPRALRAALIVLPLAACSEALGIEIYPRAVFVDANCSACIDAECTSEADACAADPACADLLTCIAGCATSDIACHDRCDTEHAGAEQSSSWKAFEGCEQGRCATTCVAPLFVEPACASCVEDNCNDLGDRCAADGVCAPLYGCMAHCPVDDWLCRADCEALNPEGVESAAFEAYDGCRRYLCLDACVGTALPLLYKKPGCAECVAANGNCEEETRACVADANCERLYVCIRDGDDPSSSWNSCIDRMYPYPIVEPAYVGAVYRCWGECAQECGVGEYWDCVGSWSVQTDPNNTMDFVADVGVHEFLVGAPVGGVAIDVCSESTLPNMECLQVDRQRTTNGQGNAKLELAIEGRNRFNGYFRLEGPVLKHFYYLPVPVTYSQYMKLFAFSDLDAFELYAQGFSPAGASAKPGLGHLLIRVQDCLADSAGGVFVDVDGKVMETAIGYLASTPENGTAPGLALSTILNVQPGPRTVVAKLKDATEVARRTVLVAADALTEVRLAPSTEQP